MKRIFATLLMMSTVAACSDADLASTALGALHS